MVRPYKAFYFIFYVYRKDFVADKMKEIKEAFWLCMGSTMKSICLVVYGFTHEKHMERD